MVQASKEARIKEEMEEVAEEKRKEREREKLGLPVKGGANMNEDIMSKFDAAEGEDVVF